MILTGAETQLAWNAVWLIPSILMAATTAQVVTGAVGAEQQKGRASTILTSPLGVPGNRTQPGTKTLTGT